MMWRTWITVCLSLILTACMSDGASTTEPEINAAFAHGPKCSDFEFPIGSGICWSESPEQTWPTNAGLIAKHQGPNKSNFDGSISIFLDYDRDLATWKGASIQTEERLSYGRYSFRVGDIIVRKGEKKHRLQDVGHLLPPSAVLGMFSYDRWLVDTPPLNEIDVEFSQWGVSGADNLNYAVYPSSPSGSSHNFTKSVPDLRFSYHVYEWAPGGVHFTSIFADGTPTADWWSPAVPWRINAMSARDIPDIPLLTFINLWAHKDGTGHSDMTLNGESIDQIEVVLLDFSYETGSAYSTVTNATTDAPIPAASVVFSRTDNGNEILKVLTSHDGTFTSGNMPPGTYDIAVSAPGYQDLVLHGIDVSASDLDLKTIQLVPLQASPLVAYYPFDGGTAVDATGNGHDGVLQAGTLTAGAIGDALYFDGVSTRIEVPDAPELRLQGSGFTFAAWVRLDSYGGLRDRPILFKAETSNCSNCITNGYEWWFGWVNDLFLSMPLKHRSDVSTTPIPVLGTWRHFAATYDKATSTVTQYVDGVPVNVVSQIPNPMPLAGVTDNSLYIGWSTNYSGSWFLGALDEIRIYNRALSPSEIAALPGLPGS